MDINIDNEKFADAYSCLTDATDLLNDGLGDFLDLDEDAFKLINKDGNIGDYYLKDKKAKDDCLDLGERMRNTIVFLSAMDAESSTYFEERFGDLSKPFSDLFEDGIDDSNPTGGVDVSEIETIVEFLKYLSSEDLALLGIDSPFVFDVYSLLPLIEGGANFLENIFDAGLKVGTEQDAMELAQMSDTYAILSALLGDEKYSNMSDLLASRSDELQTSTDIARMIAVDHSGNFVNALYDGPYDDTVAYEIIKSVVEYSPALLAKAIGGEAGQAIVVATSTYGSKLESGYAAAIANAEREGREFSEADVLAVDVRAASQAGVDAAIILAAGGVKNIGKLEENKDMTAIYEVGSYYVKATKPVVNEALDTYVFKVDETNSKGEKGPDGIVDSFDIDKVTTDSSVILVSEASADMIAKAVKGGFSDLDDSGNTNASSSKSTDTKVSSSDLVDNDGAGEYSGGEKSAASEIHKAVSFIDKSSEEIGKRVVKDAIKTGVSESNK